VSKVHLDAQFTPYTPRRIARYDAACKTRDGQRTIHCVCSTVSCSTLRPGPACQSASSVRRLLSPLVRSALSYRDFLRRRVPLPASVGPLSLRCLPYGEALVPGCTSLFHHTLRISQLLQLQEILGLPAHSFSRSSAHQGQRQ
jgi:hypothetical protein